MTKDTKTTYNEALKQYIALEKEVYKVAIEKAKESFYDYVLLMAPSVLPESFVDGLHIKLICQELQKIERSVWDETMEPGRLQLMLPPGSMKSKLASNLFPSWCLGRHPQWCFLAIGVDNEFAVDNLGRPTKELIDTVMFQMIFPGTKLKKNVAASGRWDTTRKGRFIAKGVGQNIVGRRGHITLCDDVISEQTTETDLKDINKWYVPGLRSRLLPRGAEIIINTRWFVNDLSGYLEQLDAKTDKPWSIVRIPAILDSSASALLKAHNPTPEDGRFEVGTSFWPEFWPTKLLLEKKQSMSLSTWSALYMQTPISVENSLIKKEEFIVWDKDNPPLCHYVVVSMDTAFSQKETADYSAYTVWGIFTRLVQTLDGTSIPQSCMIMLGADKGHWDLAELCNKAQELNETFSPDFFIIENKASGQSLIPELYKRGLPVIPFQPERDKTFRLQATTPYFQSGRILVPPNRKWAQDVIEEVVSFNPRSKTQKDDWTDTVSMAILWMRDNFKIDNAGFSYKPEEEVPAYRRASQTYWGSLTKRA